MPEFDSMLDFFDYGCILSLYVLIMISKGADMVRTRITVLFLSMLLLSSCGDVFSEYLDLKPGGGIILDVTSLVLEKGQSASINAIIANGVMEPIFWWSTDTSIASVEMGGFVSAHRPGTVTITASTYDRKKTGTCRVLVSQQQYPNDLASNRQYIVLTQGQSVRVPVVPLPLDAPNRTILYSKDSSAIDVAADGTITALGLTTPGTPANITAICQGTSLMRTLMVDVVPNTFELTAIIIPTGGVTELHISSGQWLAPTIQPYPSDATNVDFELFSSNPAIIEVYDNTVLIGKAPSGSATLTVKDRITGIIASITVVIDPVTIDNVWIQQGSTLMMPKGAMRQLRAYTNPDTITDQAMSWIIGDPGIVSIDSYGVLTAKSTGVTGIRARHIASGIESDPCEVTVTAPMTSSLQK